MTYALSNDTREHVPDVRTNSNTPLIEGCWPMTLVWADLYIVYNLLNAHAAVYWQIVSIKGVQLYPNEQVRVIGQVLEAEGLLWLVCSAYVNVYNLGHGDYHWQGNVSISHHTWVEHWKLCLDCVTFFPKPARAETDECANSVMWRDMTWHDMTWRDMACHDVTWRDLTSHDITWFGLVSEYQLCLANERLARNSSIDQS